jgi:hypothetical protein
LKSSAVKKVRKEKKVSKMQILQTPRGSNYSKGMSRNGTDLENLSQYQHLYMRQMQRDMSVNSEYKDGQSELCSKKSTMVKASVSKVQKYGGIPLPVKSEIASEHSRVQVISDFISDESMENLSQKEVCEINNEIEQQAEMDKRKQNVYDCVLSQHAHLQQLAEQVLSKHWTDHGSQFKSHLWALSSAGP